MRSLLAIAGMLVTGCLGGIDPAGSPSSPGSDPGSGSGVAPPAGNTDFDRAMLETARPYRSFTRVNTRAYQSSLGAFQINVYVHGDARGYHAIHPETTDPAGSTDLAIGTVIVREVLDAQGAVSKLTLMAKGPRGYDATLGDWWFAEATADGTPLEIDGVARAGRLTDCHGCHVPRATDDYMFGVPKAAQGGHP